MSEHLFHRNRLLLIKQQINIMYAYGTCRSKSIRFYNFSGVAYETNFYWRFITVVAPWVCDTKL